MNPGRRCSMRDVARVAGVSPQTVSRVASGQQKVSDDKRARVLAAMKELGYRPNSAARAMRRGSFNTIGVVFDSLHPVGTQRAVEAISEVAANRGYATTLLPMEASKVQGPDGSFTRMGEMTVDAVIAILPVRATRAEDLHLPPGMPLIVLGWQPSPAVSSVDFDQESGAREVVEHLLSLGHQTVHHLAGPSGSSPAIDRERSWRQTLEKAGRKIPPVFVGDWTPESGYLATRALLQSERPTAIFAANDQMALGAFRALLEAGLRIPQDVSVAGFDNIDESVAFPTPLTTVNPDWKTMGAEAVRVALDMKKHGTPLSATVPVNLLVRESTGPAPR